MSYISQIFDRANIQNIREFLFHGVECVEVSTKSYTQRLEVCDKPLSAMLDEKFPDFSENEEITEKINDYYSETQNVYMEIGMQCGAFIAFQLLKNFNNID